MANPPRRVVDSARATTEHAARKLGYRSQRDIEQQGERQGRFLDDQRRRRVIVPTRGLLFFREAIGGTTTQSMRRAPRLPSGDAPVQTRYPMGAAGRVLGASIWSLAARTAGTATFQVRISKGGGTEVTFDLAGCVIDGATVDGHVRSQAAELLVPWSNGIPFAKGDALRAVLVLVGWTPDPTDFGVEIIIDYDGLSG